MSKQKSHLALWRRLENDTVKSIHTYKDGTEETFPVATPGEDSQKTAPSHFLSY